ncbi:MAG: rpfG 3, partial [Bacteriovoracaceae bacterium]|nr:rpfG 3 [Bacteriovoracaceae bacterium]
AVPIELYRGEKHMDVELFMYYQGQYISYKGKGQNWTDVDTQKLTEFGVTELFVKFNSKAAHREYLEVNLVKILSRPNASIQKKALVLYELSDPMLSTIHTTPGSAEAINSASGYVRSCIKYLNDRGALPELVQLSCRNLTEHAHALHVSAYAIALAKSLGIRAYDEIFALGLGGILHDIGKSKVANEILNKAEELQNEEWLAIREHAKLGEEILGTKSIVPALSKRIVLEHHERPNGKGYPNGIKTPHPFSKMISIADAFNTLTSQKVYAPGMKPYDALKHLVVGVKGGEFDPTYLKAFVEMLSK